MGYYIQTPGIALGKAAYLVEEDGAETIPMPLSFTDIPEDRALVCVVSNGAFEAAAYVYNEAEFYDFNLPEDRRPRIWLTMPLERAQELSDYPA